MLELYYGNGRGKTNACIGAAAKAALRERKVLFVSFLPDTGEYKNSLDMMFTVSVMKAPVDADMAIEESKDSTAQASKVFRELFDTAVRTVLTQKYDMLILDGVFNIISKKFLMESEVYEFLSNVPDNIETICTGTSVDEKFITLFDFATLFSKTPTKDEDIDNSAQI